MVTIDFGRLRLAPGSRILDIGCGEGRHTAEAYGYPQTVCIGADMNHADLVTSKNKLCLHQALAGETGSVWGLASADICCLPFPDNHFDAVVCSEVLEHIPDDNRALCEVIRALKPGGVLALSVPRQWPEAVCWLLSPDYTSTPGGHIRIYTRHDLVTKVLAQGLRLVHSHYAHSLHAPFWWLKCLIGLDRDDALPVRLYHRFLVWDLMKKPALTRFLDRLLNPVLGKSLVLYFIKPQLSELS